MEFPYRRARNYPEYIRIESPPTEQNAIGEVETRGDYSNWTLVCETQAGKEHGVGREFQQAYREIAEQAYTFRIPWRPTMPSTAYQVVHENVRYEIKSAVDVMSARVEIALLCKRIDGLDS